MFHSIMEPFMFDNFHMSFMKTCYSHFMGKRVTIVVPDDLDKKLRLLQAKMIQSQQANVSYSGVINHLLRKDFKK